MNNRNPYDTFMDRYDSTVNRILNMYERMFESMVQEPRRNNATTIQPPLLRRRTQYNRLQPTQTFRRQYITPTNSIFRTGFYRPTSSIFNSRRNPGQEGLLFQTHNNRYPFNRPRRNAITGVDNIWNNVMQDIRRTRQLSPVHIFPSPRQINHATEIVSYSPNEHIHTTCPIDLLPFNENERIIRIRYCGHMFRTENLLRWFENNTRCPLCRYDIRNYTTVPSSNIENTSNNDNNETDVVNEDDNEDIQNNSGIATVTQDNTSYDTNPNNLEITSTSGIGTINNYNSHIDRPSVHIDTNDSTQTLGNSNLLHQEGFITPTQTQTQTQSPTQQQHINNINLDDIEQAQEQITTLITGAIQNVFSTIQDLSMNDITMHYGIFSD